VCREGSHLGGMGGELDVSNLICQDLQNKPVCQYKENLQTKFWMGLVKIRERFLGFATFHLKGISNSSLGK
jgi:hypothetical protein